MTIKNPSSVVSCLDSGKVKILVLPLNEFPENSWEKYLGKLNSCQKIDLSEMNSKESDEVILKKIGADGGINYNFITSIDSNMSDFIDFQLHQRVFGILGLIHGPSIDEIEIAKTEETVKELKGKFSYEIVSNILVFDSNEKKFDENIATISCQEELNEEMNKFTVSIMERMSELYSDINQRPDLPSPCGIEDYSGTASRSSSSRSRMRLSGRVQKLLADLHLLTGAYSEAVACYVSATEDAKAANDLIWSAAAQEGFNTALCLQNEQLLTEDKIDIYSSLIDKLIPLAIVYERSGTPILSIDLQITCSRVHRFIKQGSQALSVLSEAWKSCNLLSFEDKIVAYNRVLKELAVSGNWRKWSLYMVQLAQTLKLAQKPEIALMSLSRTLSIYHLSQFKQYQKTRGWPALQSALLKEMVRLSESHSNRLLYFLYGWMYLVHSNSWQDTADQVQIIENLKKKSMRDMFSLNSQNLSKNEFICSLPIFVQISLEKGNNGLFTSEKDSSEVKNGPFIYNPNSKKSLNISSNSAAFLKEDESLILGESATFNLALSNPFVFPIVLKNIYIITDDSDNPRLSEQISFTLPPMTKTQSVLINLIPEKSGELKILGFCATFMNVEIQFLINSEGKVLEDQIETESIGITFEVIEPQPFLTCSCEDLKNGLQVYEGELIETILSFNNLSSTTISIINFKILEEQKASIDPNLEINEIIFGNEIQTTFSIEIEEFDKILPINSELDQFKIPLKIYGTFNNLMKSGNLEIFYSSSSTLTSTSSSSSSKIYWRRLNFPLSVTIFPIMKIEEFSFYPFLKCPEESQNSILSKFSNVKNFENFCVCSFIAYNLETSSASASKTKLKVDSCGLILIEEIPCQSAKRLIFLIERIPKNLNMKNIKKLPLNEKKIAAVRKLRKIGTIDTDQFLDDTFEDFLYDHDQFWIKNYLIENLKIKWEIFEDQGRQGKVSLAQCEISNVYHDAIFKEHYAVRADVSVFKNVRIFDEIEINFSISPEEGEKSFILKLFPVVVLNEREVALNYDQVIKFTGCLNSIIRNASSIEPRIRTFKFYPISTATVKIIYQVVEMETGEVSWCENPILIETKLL